MCIKGGHFAANLIKDVIICFARIAGRQLEIIQSSAEYAATNCGLQKRPWFLQKAVSQRSPFRKLHRRRERLHQLQQRLSIAQRLSQQTRGAAFFPEVRACSARRSAKCRRKCFRKPSHQCRIQRSLISALRHRAASPLQAGMFRRYSRSMHSISRLKATRHLFAGR